MGNRRGVGLYAVMFVVTAVVMMAGVVLVSPQAAPLATPGKTSERTVQAPAVSDPYWVTLPACEDSDGLTACVLFDENVWEIFPAGADNGEFEILPAGAVSQVGTHIRVNMELVT